jgi:hypothetical protein
MGRGLDKRKLSHADTDVNGDSNAVCHTDRHSQRFADSDGYRIAICVAIAYAERHTVTDTQRHADHYGIAVSHADRHSQRFADSDGYRITICIAIAYA